MIVLHILIALLGIGLIIFIHEAGHFFAAKRVGVRVERFAVGFDPPVRGRNLRFFACKYGETEYVIGMIPFGGYVKMAGETLMASDDDSEERKPDELVSKSVGARALVFAAGAIMNILSAFVFFIIAFTIGVSFDAPEMGTVVPGTPVWKAGLLPGDRVLEIDDTPILNSMSLRVETALGDHSKPRRFRVARGEEELEIDVQAEWNPDVGVYMIGALPALSEALDSPPDGSIAKTLGIQKGDRWVGVEVDGVAIEDRPMTLTRILATRRTFDRASDTKLIVERGGERLVLALPPSEPATAGPSPQIGVGIGSEWLGGEVAVAFRSDAPATITDTFATGDIVWLVDADRREPLSWSAVLRRLAGGAATSELEILGASGEVERASLETRLLLDSLFRGDVHWRSFSELLGPIAEADVLYGLGFRSGDAVIALGEQNCYAKGDFARHLEGAGDGDLEVTVLRGRERVALSLAKSAAAGVATRLEQTMPPLSVVSPKSGAEAAGLRPGDIVLAVGGSAVKSWTELLDKIQSSGNESTLSVEWLARSTDVFERRSANVELRRPSAPVGLATRGKRIEVKGSILEAIEFGGRQTITMSKTVFMTLRSLVRRDVSAKNLAGPIGITQTLKDVSEHRDFAFFVYFLAIISVNLGLFNLLPIPVLDGGHLLFLLLEKIKGRPVDIRYQEWATNVALLLILALAVFVTFNDVARNFR